MTEPEIREDDLIGMRVAHYRIVRLLQRGGMGVVYEAVHEAMPRRAASVVLAHNHPSGTVQPSRADEALTQTLKAALALVDVRVLDHIIVAQGDALSMAERGLL